MAEENKNEMNTEDALDLGGLGSFDFTPDWAKGRADDKSKYARFEGREDRRDDRRGTPRPAFSSPAAAGSRGAAPFRRDDRPRGAASGFNRGDRGPARPAHDGRGPRKGFGGPREGRPPRPFIKPLDVDVRILPNQKDLGTIIRQIQTTGLAYPVKQLALFFLDHPEACVLRLTPKAGADIHFHQCKACGYVAFSEAELQAHVLDAHLTDYYTAEEIDCEPPKGNFNCVARCGLSGVLLGPPNLHGYDARIREVIREKFPDMDEAAYRARIEMVRDPEAVEAWRASVTKKMVYKRKPVEGAAADGALDAPALEREAAEFEFRRTIAPSLLSTPKAVDVTAAMALKSTHRAYVFACRDALTFERRHPRNLFRALHGAFHHRKLEFFRANGPDGQEFVCAVKPTPLDTEHAIPDLVALVKYVEEHPDQRKTDVIEALAAGDAAKAAEVKNHLAWLVEKGHLVNFHVGILAVPCAHPRYRPPQPARKTAVVPPPAESAPAPAAETVAPVDAPAAEEPKDEPAVTPVAETVAPAEEPTAAPAAEPVVETAETPVDAPAEK